MDTKELANDDIINEWFLTISAKESTKKRYLDGMKLFTEMTKKTPKELILEAEAEIKSGTLMRERRVRSHLLKFKMLLSDKKYAPKSAELRWYAIKSFYKAFEIDLPRNITNNEASPKIENMNLKFNKEDIRKMLMHCATIRDRAIILTMKSSGMAKKEITDLTYKQFREGYERETRVTTIYMRRSKVSFDFVTFIDPEGSEAVMEYLRKVGRVTKDSFFDSRFDTTPLFTTLRRSAEKLSDMTFMFIFRTLAIKMQIHEAAKKGSPIIYNPLRSHNLRKFFRTTLLHDGMDDSLIIVKNLKFLTYYP